MRRPGATAHVERLTAHRVWRIEHCLHRACRRIIGLLVAEGIGTLVSGATPLGKQETTSRRPRWVAVATRTWSASPTLASLCAIERLIYKAALVGSQVIVTEARYTGEASFLDGDPLPVYDASRQETTIFSG